MNAEKQISELGWELDCDLGDWEVWWRAVCGNFRTPWQQSPELVLRDVLALRESKKQLAKQQKIQEQVSAWEKSVRDNPPKRVI
jgi:hypothetical protein